MPRTLWRFDSAFGCVSARSMSCLRQRGVRPHYIGERLSESCLALPFGSGSPSLTGDGEAPLPLPCHELSRCAATAAARLCSGKSGEIALQAGQNARRHGREGAEVLDPLAPQRVDWFIVEIRWANLAANNVLRPFPSAPARLCSVGLYSP